MIDTNCHSIYPILMAAIIIMPQKEYDVCVVNNGYNGMKFSLNSIISNNNAYDESDTLRTMHQITTIYQIKIINIVYIILTDMVLKCDLDDCNNII